MLRQTVMFGTQNVRKSRVTTPTGPLLQECVKSSQVHLYVQHNVSVGFCTRATAHKPGQILQEDEEIAQLILSCILWILWYSVCSLLTEPQTSHV